jgi:hypothetical protein
MYALCVQLTVTMCVYTAQAILVPSILHALSAMAIDISLRGIWFQQSLFAVSLIQISW